jgi:rare lipoprotein A
MIVKPFFFFLLIFLCNACNLLTPTNSSSNPSSGKVFTGQASFYANKFHGKPTASGEKYDKNKLTAAHKTLPFSTEVEVTNTKNNKTVIVKINDRLPTSSSREIDLSEAAAKKLEMIQDGVVNVKIKVR